MSQLELANQRLSRQQFITHPADENLFQALVREVNSLKRGDEKVDIPDVHGAGAWARLWATWEAMRRRPPPERAVFVAPAYSDGGGADGAWTGFLANREALAGLIEKQRIDSDTLEFVGVEPGDLAEPVIKVSPENPWGRPAYWQERARRISAAITKLQTMSTIERALIPLVKRVAQLELLMSKEKQHEV
jgi:hypothetical protein